LGILGCRIISVYPCGRAGAALRITGRGVRPAAPWRAGAGQTVKGREGMLLKQLRWLLAAALVLLLLAGAAQGQPLGEALSDKNIFVEMLVMNGLKQFKQGVEFSKTGDHPKAAKAFKQAVRLDPKSSLAHLCLGITYVDLGDRKSAMKQYEILKTLSPKRADALLDLIQRSD